MRWGAFIARDQHPLVIPACEPGSMVAARKGRNAVLAVATPQPRVDPLTSGTMDPGSLAGVTSVSGSEVAWGADTGRRIEKWALRGREGVRVLPGRIPTLPRVTPGNDPGGPSCCWVQGRRGIAMG